MDKESLKIAREIVLIAIDEAKINKIDKCELMRNLYTLLDEENYEKDIKVLKLEEKNRKNR